MKELVKKISSENLVSYLTIKGWTCSSVLFEGLVTQCITPDGSDAVLIPNDKNFVDYYTGLERALCVIAEYEGITLKHLYNKLLNPSSDLLSWRIADDMTESGSIPFNSMSVNIDYIKDMISSACLDILAPSRYHAKLYTKDVIDQVSKYRFGQTEIGSYILNILSPLGFYQYKMFDQSVEDMPIARQINLRMMNNINTVQKSAEDNSSEMSEKVDSGIVSVNFLKALTGLYDENQDSEVTINADWSNDVPLASEPISQIQLKPRCIDKVIEVVEKYSPKQEQNVASSYFGKITNIGAEAEVNNRDTVEIKIATVGENLRTVTVNATLDYAKYFSIVEQAFQTGMDVKVSGIRTSSAKSIKLSNASIEKAQ